MHIELNETVDITGLATVVLAAGTLILAFATRRAARATSEQSVLLRHQLTLERRQLAESHRPVVVPLDSYETGELDEDGDPVAVMTVATTKRAVIPVENVGVGPALNLRLSIAFPGGEYTIERARTVLGANNRSQLEMLLSRDMDSFFAPAALLAVEIAYEGVTGEKYLTCAHFDKCWQSLAISSDGD